MGRYAVRSARGIDRHLLGAGPLVVAALACVLVALLRLQSCLATGWAGRTLGGAKEQPDRKDGTIIAAMTARNPHKRPVI